MGLNLVPVFFTASMNDDFQQRTNVFSKSFPMYSTSFAFSNILTVLDDIFFSKVILSLPREKYANTKHPYEPDWQVPLGVRAIGL